MYDEVVRDNNGFPVTVISKDKRLKLTVIGYIEPNNGRELLEVNTLLDGESINDKVFPKSKRGTWNYVQMSIDKLVLSSQERTYFFVPTESSGVVLDHEGKMIIRIPPVFSRIKNKYWRSNFVGNFFKGNQLILMYSNQIVLADIQKCIVKYCFMESEMKIYNGEILNEIFFKSI